MTRLSQFLVFIILGVIIISCDCLQQVNGTVIDSNTKLPIDSVIISRYVSVDTTIELNHNIYSDKDGNFEFSGMTIGLFGCPRIKIVVEKNGYESTIKKFRSCCTENDTIYLRELKIN